LLVAFKLAPLLRGLNGREKGARGFGGVALEIVHCRQNFRGWWGRAARG